MDYRHLLRWKEETFLKLRADNKEPLVILLTAFPENIDKQILHRCEEHVQTEVPDFSERRVLLRLLIDHHFKIGQIPKPSVLSSAYWFSKKLSIEEGVILDELLDELAAKIEGFTGRDINSLAYKILIIAARGDEENKITSALINRVVDSMIKAKQEFNDYMNGDIHAA